MAFGSQGWCVSFVAIAAVFFQSVIQAKASPTPPEGSPVAQHGHLHVQSNFVVGEHGEHVQLRGMSLPLPQWEGKFWNADAIDWLVEDWNVSLVRAPMGVEMGGYLTHPAQYMAMLEDVVDECLRQGIYVIIAWHHPQANAHNDDARMFFANVSNKYGENPNVLFELWHQQDDLYWGKDIKPIHETTVTGIRKHSQNIIILATDTFSAGVDAASADPVEGANIAYSFQFYGTSYHKDVVDLRKMVEKALANGVALFVTEWGTCAFHHNSTLDLDNTRTWIDFLAEHSISHANWAVSDAFESCSALVVNASALGRWTDADLTESGYYVRNMLKDIDRGEPCRVDTWPCVSEQWCASADQNCNMERCCAEPGQHCWEKDAGWAQCMETCEPGIHEGDLGLPSEWTCEELFPVPHWYQLPVFWATVLSVLGLAAGLTWDTISRRRAQDKMAVPLNESGV